MNLKLFISIQILNLYGFVISHKKSNDGLVNYWPLDNDLNDKIGKKDLFNAKNIEFISDAQNNSNGSLDLSNGFVQAPKGVYFSGDFTFIARIKIYSFSGFSIFDFGTVNRSDNVILKSVPLTNELKLIIFNGNESSFHIKGKIGIDSWNHIAIVLKKGKAIVYYNGFMIDIGKVFKPRKIERTLNFFGKSNSDRNMGDMAIDEIKIYNIALSKTDIANDYNLNKISQSSHEKSSEKEIESYFDYDGDPSYLGCFKDNSARDLDGLYFGNYLYNTPESCINYCTDHYFKYSGLQNGYQCWCGDSVNKFGRAYNCDSPCSGDGAQLCGGHFANSVFKNEIEKTNSETISESRSLVITCPEYQAIEIKFAMYGNIRKKCVANIKQTMKIIKRECESFNSCELISHPEIFGYFPCQNVGKKLLVKYICS